MTETQHGNNPGIGEWMGNAWKATNGAKWGIHKALLITVLLMIPLSLATSLIPEFIAAKSGNATIAFGVVFIGQLAYLSVITPINVAFTIIGAERSAGRNIDSRFLWKYFDEALPLLLAYLLLMALVAVGFLLLIIPGIYLMVSYVFALPLIGDKKMDIWEALETSRKTVSKRWFSVFGLIIMISLVNAVAAIPLGIGLIWSIPWSMIALGGAYRDLFGYEPDQPAMPKIDALPA